MKKFKAQLRRAGKISPESDFRKEARMRLFGKISTSNESWVSNVFQSAEIPIPSAQLKHSFLDSLLVRVGAKPETSFWTFLLYPRTIAIASIFAILFTTVFSFFTFTSPISADEKTFISDLTGLVEIGKIDDIHYKTANIGDILEDGLVVRTGENSSAEITFFEDSIIRLDSNTEIEVRKLLPHSSIKQIGDVAISLNFGKIWVRSFDEDSEFSAFEVHSGDVVIFPQKGVFDLYRNGNLNTIRVFERSAKISNRGEKDRATFLLIAGSKITISLLGIGDTQEIASEELTEQWISNNLAKNEKDIENFITRRTESIENTSTISNLLAPLKPDTADKFLSLSENHLHEAINSLNEQNPEKANKEIDKFINNLQEAVKIDPSVKKVAKAFIQNESKYLQFTLPEDQLFPAKKALDKAREVTAEDEQNMRAVQEQIAKETLWETHELASSAEVDSELITTHLEAFSDKLKELPSEENADPIVVAEILDQKSQELQILDNLQVVTSSQPQEVLNTVEEEIITDIVEMTTDVVPVSDETNVVEKTDNTVNDLVNRVQIYSSYKGQENTVRAIVSKFDNDAENLPTLMEFKQQLPRNVQWVVSEKMAEIIRAEKQQAIIEAH